MLTGLTVSQEFIATGGNKFFAPELMAHIEKLQSAAVSDTGQTETVITGINRMVKKHLGLTISFVIEPDKTNISAFCAAPNFSGHNVSFNKAGLKAHSDGGAEALFNSIRKSTVDLNRVKITGPLTEFEFVIGITHALVLSDRFTLEEKTAIVLHELGHAFFTLATLGEYCWLNYYLTDGVDVVLGKKPNTYKIEVLDHSYLERTLTDPAVRNAFLSAPNEANMRRAIISVVSKDAKNTLTTNVVRGSMKRNEQLADVFVARLGMALPLATAVHKLYAAPWSGGRRYQRGKANFVAMEACKMLNGVLSVAIGVSLSMFIFAFGMLVPMVIVTLNHADGYVNPDYDNPTERLMKLRREMIEQLKSYRYTSIQKTAVVADIELLDKLLSNSNQYRSVFELVGYALAPNARREQQRLKHEEQLEQLLSNDLFVKANQFKSL